MVLYWVFVLAVAALLYVVLDGFDLGIGILFGLSRSEARRRTMLSAVAPIWDGNETWLIVVGVVLWGAFPVVYATLLSAFYLPLLVMLAGSYEALRSNFGTRPSGCGGFGMLALLVALLSQPLSKA
jgi:cytochrome d ubiquinol oxidase subunit II